MVLFIKAMVLILALLSKDRNFTLARGIGEELGLELDVLLLFLDLHSSVGKHVRNTPLELKDGMSIAETFSLATDQLIPQSKPNVDTQKSGSICSDYAHKLKVEDSITRVLNFYQNHEESIAEAKDVLGFVYLKLLAEKHGDKFESMDKTDARISYICNKYASGTDEIKRDFCLKVQENLISRNKIWSGWRNPDAIEVESERFPNPEIEKETIWGELNGECQLALINRCEVPHICEQTFFDPVPRSQYMLTHQLLSRQMAATSKCLPEKSRFVDSNVELGLCAKMYKESEVLGGYLQHVRLSAFGDLLSEHIAFCGYSGYPNFFRVDWLERLLELQSKSEYGCFLEENLGKFVTTSKKITRKLTKSEVAQGRSESGEQCSSHFTSVALMALTMYSDYIEDNCKY